MSGGLSRRAARLEALHGGEPCPECGFAGDLSKVDFEVRWHDAEPDGPAEPKWCGTCGQQLEYVVRWHDIPDRRGNLPPGAA